MKIHVNIHKTTSSSSKGIFNNILIYIGFLYILPLFFGKPSFCRGHREMNTIRFHRSLITGMPDAIPGLDLDVNTANNGVSGRSW